MRSKQASKQTRMQGSKQVGRSGRVPCEKKKVGQVGGRVGGKGGGGRWQAGGRGR